MREVELNIIELDGCKRLTISCAYNKENYSRCKSLVGSKWESKLKIWFTTLTENQCRQVIRIFEGYEIKGLEELRKYFSNKRKVVDQEGQYQELSNKAKESVNHFKRWLMQKR